MAEVRYATADTLGDAVDGADAVLIWDFFSGALQTVWPRAKKLRWVHAASAGVDTLLFDSLVDSDVLVTNSRGVFDRPIAEFVLGSILAFAKGSAKSIALQAAGTWEHRQTEQIGGARALVVGTGSIGRETARLLTAVGMQVEGVGRTARTDDSDFGRVHASTELASLVRDVDYLVLLAPLTDQTRGLVDKAVLAAMPATARLINVGRGELVVTDHVVDALRAGVIAGAALDVFETEPLPPDHPLWSMEQVLITPHMSGDAVGWRDRLADLFIDNAFRYFDGKPLINVVDKKRGYVPG
ncbi:D-2-hydroxyacid dehydrogenase [Antrihabitans cavernicola]|uniref:D-2-hydroxyacid dehydrogenase n=2 Tax=Antrihabitans cavernicola TaxID=2495913 RepID=A0A5A7SB70_9NOCA|nr:D-2-hydroxyacid dehydrogenase [Spelaeibacter cavernicola]KAA0022774.1 D-2-hydroxyacid dehydrogenase [Spelaeibacter cavernicola]